MHLRADAGRGRERLAPGLVRHQLDARDEARPPHVAHQRMVAQRLQPGQEHRRHLAHMADDVALLVDLQRLERHRAGDGMAAIGEAMAERAVAPAALQQRVMDAAADHQRRDRLIGRRELLGAADHVRLDAVGLAAPHRCRCARSRRSPRRRPAGCRACFSTAWIASPIAARRRDRAAAALHRLAEERRDRVRTLRLDQRLQRVGHPRAERLLALALVVEAVVVRVLRVHEAGQRQAEPGMHVRLPGQADRRHRVAVIAAHPADDLPPLRLALDRPSSARPA